MVKYTAPDMDVIYFETEDILTESGPGTIVDPTDPDEW